MRVMVAFDGSNASKVALEFSLFFENSIDSIYVVYVVPHMGKQPPTFDEYTLPEDDRTIEKTEMKGNEILDQSRRILEPLHVKSEFELVDDPDRSVGENLMRIAINHDVDLILMGERKLGTLGKVFFDSVSSRLLKESQIPVLVIPPRFTRERITKIEHD
jgi:nucleotide-binding universal stress UspA family protein